MAFDTLFGKQEPAEYVSVSFQIADEVRQRVQQCAANLSVSQSAVWRALAMDALPRLEKALKESRS